MLIPIPTTEGTYRPKRADLRMQDIYVLHPKDGTFAFKTYILFPVAPAHSPEPTEQIRYFCAGVNLRAYALLSIAAVTLGLV